MTDADLTRLAAVLLKHLPHLGGAGPTADVVAREMFAMSADLMSSRCGTMTAEVLEQVLSAVTVDYPTHGPDLRQHIASLGARLATLEEEAARTETYMKFEHVAKGALLKELFAIKEAASAKGLYDLRDARFKAEGERDEAVARIAELEADVRRLTDERDAFRATIAREATTTEAWRQRCERAADALADVMPGETGRLDLVTRIHALKTELEEARTELAKPKSNPPISLESSGQVAELADQVRRAIAPLPYSEDKDAALANVYRLASLAQQGQEAKRLKDCTCLGSCRGAEVLGDGWRCVLAKKLNLEPAPLKAATVDGAPWRCAAGTCGHDDAKEPGHAELVAERGKAFTEAACVPPAGSNVPVPLADARVSAASWRNGYDSGAEAMRAACWEALQAAIQRLGLNPNEKAVLKTAIEGAAP